MNVKRYDLLDMPAEMVEEKEGEWVRYADIAALLAELDHLRARLEVTPQGPDGIDARDETIRALEADRDSWERQASDRTDDAVQFARERDEARAERDALREDASTHQERSKFLLNATREAQDLGSMWVAEVLAWRATFPQYTYRRQDDCISLAARGMGEAGK